MYRTLSHGQRLQLVRLGFAAGAGAAQDPGRSAEAQGRGWMEEGMGDILFGGLYGMILGIIEIKY